MDKVKTCPECSHNQVYMLEASRDKFEYECMRDVCKHQWTERPLPYKPDATQKKLEMDLRVKRFIHEVRSALENISEIIDSSDIDDSVAMACDILENEIMKYVEYINELYYDDGAIAVREALDAWPIER